MELELQHWSPALWEHSLGAMLPSRVPAKGCAPAAFQLMSDRCNSSVTLLHLTFLVYRVPPVTELTT